MASADLLLHPVRIRAVQAFLGDRALTTTRLAAELDDVPAGSLYRHVAILTKAGVLQVVAERRVRGAVERTYTLRLPAAQIGAGEAAAMTPAEHGQAFMAFAAGLLAGLDRYLAADTPDPGKDGVDYRTTALWLTDAEFTELLGQLLAIVQPRFANAPCRGRRRRMLASVIVPAPEGGPAGRKDLWHEMAIRAHRLFTATDNGAMVGKIFSAVANDGILSLASALVVLLVLRWALSSPIWNVQDEPETAPGGVALPLASARPQAASAGAAPPLPRVGTGQYGEAAAGRAGGLAGSPKVSGSPPWGPAPRPPGLPSYPGPSRPAR